MAIDDATYTALCEIARWKVPNLAKRDSEGNFLRFCDESEVVDAVTTALEDAWGIELDTGEYTTDDRRGIWDAYRETHISAMASQR